MCICLMQNMCVCFTCRAVGLESNMALRHTLPAGKHTGCCTGIAQSSRVGDCAAYFAHELFLLYGSKWDCLELIDTKNGSKSSSLWLFATINQGNMNKKGAR